MAHAWLARIVHTLYALVNTDRPTDRPPTNPESIVYLITTNPLRLHPWPGSLSALYRAARAGSFRCRTAVARLDRFVVAVFDGGQNVTPPDADAMGPLTDDNLTMKG